MSGQVLASTFHQLLADMVFAIEAQQSSTYDCFCFCDEEKTLQISFNLLEYMRLTDDWSALVERYKQMGGNIWCSDEPKGMGGKRCQDKMF